MEDYSLIVIGIVVIFLIVFFMIESWELRYITLALGIAMTLIGIMLLEINERYFRLNLDIVELKKKKWGIK